MIGVERITGVRLVDKVEVSPELWAAMHSAAMKMDIGQGGVYDSRLNKPLHMVAAAEEPVENGANAGVGVWGIPEDKPESFPAAEDMTGEANGIPCEYVGAWISVEVNNSGEYVVERDVKTLSDSQENGGDPKSLMRTSQEKGKEILREAKSLGLPVEPVIVWNPAGSTIRWVEKKWEKLKRAAVQELPSIDREALCPLCEEWKLKGENPVEKFLSHLRKGHDLEEVTAREGSGDVSVWSSGGALTPVYRRIQQGN
ncbi:hypothetical protein AKJ41_05155 [candidate division MSBL1 archaeon SCGC-AAA259O05]|uniref:Uncharacterized protein n=1 Tax=candidate division MSBL1 archaeon SCGC-AAA259O05 TaxID=1698271 RepID=A0A133UZL9_9EURY|nr:hypothetical protein AKJ41_05155 [candidate division MSBL1 archaeon SCGC-AAA259O05]